MPHLCQGRIIWAPFADKNGYNKYPRPIIILDKDESISGLVELTGVVASTTAANYRPRPDYCIEIPYHSSGRVCTRLKSPTVAVCNWPVAVTKDNINEKDMAGTVPTLILERIVLKYIELNT